MGLNLNWIDYVIIALIGLSVLISLIRGFVREVLSLASWIAAFLIAFNFAHSLSLMFVGHIKSPTAQFVIAFAILFIAALLVGAVVNYLISNLVKKTGLSGTDRVLGMALGGVRGVLIVSILILLAGFTSLPKDAAWNHSYLLPHFTPCVTWLEHFIPDALDFVTGQ